MDFSRLREKQEGPKEFNPEDTQSQLLPPAADKLNVANRRSPNLSKGKMVNGVQSAEQDIDTEFLQLADLQDYGVDHLETALENFDEVAFDTFNYCQFLGDKSMHYII